MALYMQDGSNTVIASFCCLFFCCLQGHIINFNNVLSYIPTKFLVKIEQNKKNK